MTTVYLVKRLLSLKRRKKYYETTQYLKKYSMREMTETNRALQTVNKYRVINSCRLCLKPAAETYIYNNKDGINFAEDVKNILNIEIRLNDGKPQYICLECGCILRKAVELKQVAEVAQWRLELEAETFFKTNCDSNGDSNNHEHKQVTKFHVNESTSTCNETKPIPNIKNICKEKAKKPKRRYKRGSFICEVCGLQLKTTFGLKSHMRVHVETFNYSCSYCPYRAREGPFSVQIHERRHTGHRPYHCVQCNATYTSCSNLASHRRKHLPPTIKCDHCPKRFKYNQENPPST